MATKTQNASKMAVNRQWVRIFLTCGDPSPCNCPEHLCTVQATAPSLSRGTPNRSEIWDCHSGRYVSFRSCAGELGPVTMDLRTCMTMNRGLFLDWMKRGYKATLHIAYGQCDTVNQFNQADAYATICDVYPTALSGDDLFAADNETLKDVLYETLSIEGDGRSFDRFSIPTPKEYAANLPIVTAINDVVLADQYSSCEDEGPSCKACGAVYLIDEDADGNGIIHALNCSKCADGVFTRQLNAPILDVVETQYGLVVLTDGGDGLTYWGLLPYDCVCDADVAFSTMPDPVMAALATGASACDSTVYVTGPTGFLSTLDIATGAVTVIEDATTGNFPAAWNGVTCTDNGVALAYGQSGQLAKTNNGFTFEAIANSPTTADIVGVHAFDDTTFTLIDSMGGMYKTSDCGVSWSTVSDPVFAGVTEFTGISFANGSAGYVTGIVNGLVQAWATYNGCCAWTKLPRGKSLKLPKMDEVTGMATCCDSVDVVYIAGKYNGDWKLLYGDGN